MPEVPAQMAGMILPDNGIQRTALRAAADAERHADPGLHQQPEGKQPCRSTTSKS
jgi:hypothetical protein